MIDCQEKPAGAHGQGRSRCSGRQAELNNGSSPAVVKRLFFQICLLCYSYPAFFCACGGFQITNSICILHKYMAVIDSIVTVIGLISAVCHFPFVPTEHKLRSVHPINRSTNERNEQFSNLHYAAILAGFCIMFRRIRMLSCVRRLSPPHPVDNLLK